ncbi:protein IMPACT homolog [Crassostrea virginica]
MKEDVLQSQRQLRQQQQETPFHVSPQYPSSLVENRKHLSELQKKYTEQKVETKIKGNKLVFKNGNVYKDKVLVPRAEDVLLALDEEKEALGHIEVVTSEEKREKGNRFIANAAEAKTYGDVRKVYKKICSIPIHAQASHRILVYRFTDKDGKLIDGYMDDGEYGAGRNLLKHLEERRLNNVVCVVTRWYGGEHLGGMRFELMKDVATEAAQKLNP